MQRENPKLPMYRTRFKTPNSVNFLIDGSSAGNPFMNDIFRFFLSPDTFSIACDLFYLTHILDLHTTDPKRFGPNQCEYFEDTFAKTQHALVSLPYPENLAVKSFALTQQHCWRIGALIYFNTALRFSPSPTLLKSMTTGLIEAFSENDTSTAWHPFENVLLWVYFMGYMGSDDPYKGPQAIFERKWFMEEARSVVNILGLKSCGEMKEQMKGLLFRETSHSQSLEQLWIDFE
jgi:hypothetical protein